MTELKENIIINERKDSTTKKSSPKSLNDESYDENAAPVEVESPTSHKNPLVPPELIETSSTMQLKMSKKVSSSSTPKRSHRRTSTKDKDATNQNIVGEDNNQKRKSALQEVTNVATPVKHTRRIRRSSSSNSINTEESGKVEENCEIELDIKATAATVSSSSDEKKKKKSRKSSSSSSNENEKKKKSKETREDEKDRKPVEEENIPEIIKTNEERGDNDIDWMNRELTEKELAAGHVILRVLRSAVIHRRWHDLVSAYSHSPASKSCRKRLCIIRELISTERSYTSSLTTLINQYIFPLKVEAMKRNGIISKENLDKIFANIEEINSLNTAMLRDLDTVMRGAPAGGLPIGATMLPHIRVFSMYSLYVNSYTLGAELLTKLRRTSKPFAAFLQAAADKTAEPLDITSYLIMPVQRIPRYKLLLEDLVRHTDESDRDRDSLIMCLAEVRALAEKINERRRLADSNAKLVEIQSHLTERIDLFQPARRFVREDRFAVEASVKGLAAKSAPTLFLFNDSLLYVDKLDSGKLRYRGFWPLTDITLTESVPYSYAPADAVRMFILSCEKIHRGKTELIVTTDSAETKASWIADFAEHKATQIDRNEKMRISAAAAEEGVTIAATPAIISAAAAAAATPAVCDALSPLPLLPQSSHHQITVAAATSSTPSPGLTGSGRARSNTFGCGRNSTPLAAASSAISFNPNSSPSVDDDAEKEIVIIADACASASKAVINTSIALSRHGRNLSSSSVIPPPPLEQSSPVPPTPSASGVQSKRNFEDQEVPRTPLRRNMHRRASEKIELSSRLSDDIPPPPLPSSSSASSSSKKEQPRRALSSSGGRNSAASEALVPPQTPSQGSKSGSAASIPVAAAFTPARQQEEEVCAMDLTELLREEARVIEEIRAEYRAAIDATSRLELATQQCEDAESLAAAHSEQSATLQRRLDEERRRLATLKEARSTAQKRTTTAQKALSAANERLLAAQARTHAAERQAASLTAQLHDTQRRQRQLADENALAEVRAEAIAAETRTLTARCERAEAATAAATAQIAELREAIAAAEASCARAAERKETLVAEISRAEDAADELAARSRKLARAKRAADAERAQLTEALASAEAAKGVAERSAAQLEREKAAAAEELEEMEAQEAEREKALDAARAELKTLTQKAHSAQKERKEAETKADSAVEKLAEMRRKRAELERMRSAAMGTRETLDGEMARAMERCSAEHARCAAALADIERVQAETSVVRKRNEDWTAALAQIKETVVVCKEKTRQVEELACTLGTYADNFTRHRAQVEEAFNKLK